MGPIVKLGGDASSLPLEQRITLGKHVMESKDIPIGDKIGLFLSIGLLDPLDYPQIAKKYGWPELGEREALEPEKRSITRQLYDAGYGTVIRYIPFFRN